MVKRAPSPPPRLPGLRALQHLGSGGFADVFLYEQDLPRRRVAVKVLIDEVVSDDVRRRFTAEANAMAQLSAHPSIVTIYQAGMSEDGRPYLVMEFCPQPNLAVRFRRERIAVAEALRIGIRLASAVQTAHEAGILHRDIKPANVLVTEYGWPALSDFGIAAQIEGGSVETEGLSVPWSAPELFAAHPRSDRRTDIYSLGATVYALLAGRSPFERSGDNATAALIGRIERNPVPPTGREDGSPLLEQVLARSLHKRSEARYRSALEFAQALQGVEVSLGLPQTAVDVMPVSDPGGAAAAGRDHDDDATRVRGITEIEEDASTRLQYSQAGGPAREAAGDPAPVGSPVRLVLGLLALVLVIGVVVGVLVFGPRGETGAPPSPTPSQNTGVLGGPAAPDPPGNARCTRDGSRLECRWSGPSGAQFQWNLQERPTDISTVAEPRLRTTLPGGVAPCVAIRTLGEGGAASGSTVACAS